MEAKYTDKNLSPYCKSDNFENKKGEAKAYSSLGDPQGNLKTVTDYTERQLRKNELGDKSGEDATYCSHGNTPYSLGNFKAAIQYHERALKIAKELGDRLEEGIACCNLGNAHLSLGDFKTAIDYHESHLKIAKELDDRLGEGTAYGNLGNTHRTRGDFKTAMYYNELHLNIAKELGDKSGELAAYGNLGIAHYSLGDFKTAIHYQERVLKIAKDLGDRSGEGKAYGNLGIVHRNLGDFETAVHYNERSLKIAKELGEKAEEGTAYGNLGNAHLCLGNIKTAIDYYERHLNIAKDLGDKMGERAACSGLGIAHDNLADFGAAIKYHKRSLKIAEELGDKLGKQTAYGNLGIAHYSLGDFEAAMKYQERALKIAKELGNKSGEAAAYDSLGIIHRCLGNFEGAIKYHEGVLKIAKELGDRSGEAKANGNLGNAYSCLGDFNTAKDYYERDLDISKEQGDTLGEGIACSNLGSLLESLGQFPVAIEYYQRGVALLNNIRDRLQLNDEWKISIRDHYQRVYAALWRLMLAGGNVAEAMFSAEQGRAQGLKDLIELNYAFERSDAGSRAENGTVNDLLSNLPSNTVFMAFGENELIFWVCQRGKCVELRKKQIISRDKVNTFFQALLQILHQEIGTTDLLKCEDRSLELARDKRLIANTSPQNDRQSQLLDLQSSALSTLYDTIIEPIQDLLSGSELIFIPEGSLCLAPFAAFQSPDSKYLCESFKIRVAPSLTSLKMIADCPVDHHHKSGALLVGDPLTELQPLPSAREEVGMIGQMLGSTPLIGEQATKDEVLRRLCSVALVHIAAHGNMETGEIALASNEGVKTVILTMRDVLRVQMRARLVVLSCCHSALGEIKAEGVVGIARAFLGAGARSVVVSLWAIDDEATLEFMKNFYHHLLEGKNASEALNQAMNCMRESEEFSAVKYWAPFVLIGDDVTLEFSRSK